MKLAVTNPVEIEDRHMSPAPLLRHSNGYLLQWAPNHPLARNGRRRVYAHRVAFYDANGTGPFPCHVCGNAVTWDTMHVDHLDGCKTNNDPENLKAACPKCNQARGKDKMRASVRAARATWLEYSGERLTLLEWSERVGIARESLRQRLRAGWSIERALTEPRGPTGPKRAA